MVFRFDVTIPPLTGEKVRRGYIYLPDDYDRDVTRRYPVMYMFDGHNVFFDADATYGKSWGMAEYMDRSKKQLIIVAVECNQEGYKRLEEYAPVNFEFENLGRIVGKGKVYMDWLVDTLKPMIDARYRTVPDREHTIICGSSMGGLMSLYAATCYNHVFQKAACLSPSIWVAPDHVLNLISSAKVTGDTCIYMDYGSEEIDNHASNREALTAVADHLLKNSVHLTFRIVPGGTHCEASWEKQIPIFMECLSV